MSTSAIYEVIDALVDQLPTALDPLGVVVFDGFPDSDDPGFDYLAVGLPDPNEASAADSASSQQSWASIGAQDRDESGEVQCFAVAANGDGDLSAARARLRAITAAVETYLRDNYTLKADPDEPTDPGVPQLLWIGYGASTDLQQGFDNTGVFAQVVFSISFRARI